MSAGTERRLAAIVSADVVGYARLMGADEAGTLASLRAHRQELWNPTIERFGGRVVGTAGDAILVEFASAVAAVECSIAIQRGMVERNAGLPTETRMDLRIGVNIGEVIMADDDIFGDGVNVAARLQEIAPPGGLAVSANVHEQIEGKVAHSFIDDGLRELRNIARPVAVWRWSADGQPSPRPAAASARVSPGEKPSIAVLPFANLSGDPDQEYFADGLTEDLITELSRFQSLSVIARNSTFTYKGRAVRVQDVGRELGVEYLVEGSVRKMGARVRVSVQLVEATTGTHLWADRFDRELDQIFELQDELVRAIVATVSGRLEGAVAERIKSKPPKDLNAYDCVMRAKLLHHRGEPQDNDEALKLLDTALELEPGYAAAYGWKVCVLSQAWTRGYRAFQDGDYDNAVDLIKKGFAEDENDLECVRILGEYYIETKQFEEAERFNDKALRLNPNDPRILAQRGELLTWLGRPEDAVAWLRKAIDLDPYSADEWAHLLGRAYFGEKRYEDALRAFKRVPRMQVAHRAFLAACLGHLGRRDEASTQLRAIAAADPGFSATTFAAGLFYKNQEDEAHLLAGLEKAGLTD